MTIRKPLIVGVMVAALFSGGTGLANAAGLVPTPWDSHSVPTGPPGDDSAPDGHHDSSVPTGHHEGN